MTAIEIPDVFIAMELNPQVLHLCITAPILPRKQTHNKQNTFFLFIMKIIVDLILKVEILFSSHGKNSQVLEPSHTKEMLWLRDRTLLCPCSRAENLFQRETVSQSLISLQSILIFPFLSKVFFYTFLVFC